MRANPCARFLIAITIVLFFLGCQQINVNGGDVPQKPTGIIVAAGEAVAAVSWDDIGADSYTVYWEAGTSATKGSPNKHTGITALSYNITGLTNSTQYAFVVTGTNSAGESVASTVATATPLAAPASPGMLVVVSSSTSIGVSWTAVSGAATYDLYYAQGATVDTGSLTNFQGITGTSQSIPSLTSNTAYALLLVAKNLNGTATAGSVLPWGTAPDAPTINQPQTIGTGTFQMTWPAITGATGYYGYMNWSTSPNPTVTKSTYNEKTDNGVSLTFSALGLVTSRYYAYIATARNAYGESDPSTTQIVVPAPTSFFSGQFLNWYWPGGADLTNNTGVSQTFIIQESPNGTSSWTTISGITIPNGSQNMWSGSPTSTRYYRVAHEGSYASAADGFPSNASYYP
jgi:hypothetical protein